MRSAGQLVCVRDNAVEGEMRIRGALGARNLSAQTWSNARFTGEEGLGFRVKALEMFVFKPAGKSSL